MHKSCKNHLSVLEVSNYIVWLRSPKPNKMPEPERGGRRQSMVVHAPCWCESIAGASGKRCKFQRHSNVCLPNQKSCKGSKSGFQAPKSWIDVPAFGFFTTTGTPQEGGTRLEVGGFWGLTSLPIARPVPTQPLPTQIDTLELIWLDFILYLFRLYHYRLRNTLLFLWGRGDTEDYIGPRYQVC